MRKITTSLLEKNKGFTLLELVVVFSIMAVLSTIGVASFVNYSREQTLQQTTNDLVTQISTAKSAAASQVTSLNSGQLSCASGLRGYGVAIDVTHNKYNMYVKCASVVGPTPVPPSLLLPSGITFDNTSTITDVFFPILIGGVVLNNGTLSSGKIVVDGFSSAKKTISIDSVTGIVTVQ